MGIAAGTSIDQAIDTSPTEGHIVVDETVHISSARLDVPHYGCTVDADPSRPGRLFAASMHAPRADVLTFGGLGYYSHDGGETWELGCEHLGRSDDERCCDESLARLAHMRTSVEDKTDSTRNGGAFLASADGGRTWAELGAPAM